MKQCPQCNRVETDDSLVFCRVDGAALVNNSSELNGDSGTLKLATQSGPTEIETSILPHLTNAGVSRGTGPTTVLPPPSVTTGSLAKPKQRRKALAIAAVVTAVMAAITAVVVNSYLSRKSQTSIQSIAVMPFVNDSGNADVEYLSDGMTETLISSLSQLPNLNFGKRGCRAHIMPGDIFSQSSVG